MYQCLVTLPITPTTNPPLGLIASILVGDFAARNLGLRFVLALGPQMLLKKENRDQTISAFLRHLTNVGIRPDYVWRSDAEENQVKVREFFMHLHDNSLISKNEALVDICPCGAVERLSESVEWYEKRRLYTIDSDGLRCKFCKELTEQKKQLVYRLSSKSRDVSIEPYPCFYANEIEGQIRSFQETDLVISRTRESSVKITIAKEEIRLDQDFAWQMYLSTLPSLGFEPKIILGSNHNLRALVLIGALEQAISNTRVLQTIIPPYFLGEGKKRLGAEYHMDVLSNIHEKNSIRALVGNSLNWAQKESVLQTSQLPLFDKMKNRLNNLSISGEPVATVQEFLDTCEFRKIRTAIGSVRGNKGLTNVRSLFGIIDP